MIIVAIALALWICSIVWAAWFREMSALYLAVMAAVTLYVLSAAQGLLP